MLTVFREVLADSVSLEDADEEYEGGTTLSWLEIEEVLSFGRLNDRVPVAGFGCHKRKDSIT